MPDYGEFEKLYRKENRLLSSLPAQDQERLRPAMTLIALRRGQVLHEPGVPMQHVYFPISGLVSLLHILKDGRTAELAVVGDDGCVGIEILLGGGSTPSRAVVQIEGFAYRVDAAIMVAEVRRAGLAQRALLGYVQALMTQVSQTAVCNRHHAVEQQMCRWFLLTLERVPAKGIRMTQEQISDCLGVRRTSIGHAAKRLRDAGLIEYRRGIITVSDPAKLDAHACECYGVVKTATQRLLLPPSA